MTDAERTLDIAYLDRMVAKGTIPPELRTRTWVVLNAMPATLPAPAMAAGEWVDAWWDAGPYHLSVEVPAVGRVYWFWCRRDTDAFGGGECEPGEMPAEAREWAALIAGLTGGLTPLHP